MRTVIPPPMDEALPDGGAARPASGGWKIGTGISSDTAALFGWLAPPCVLFYAYIGQPLLGLAFAAVLIPVLLSIRTDAVRSAAVGNRVALACAFAAIALTTVGGEGRIFAPTPDWLVRDAVLHDLVVQPWPFVYRIGAQDWWLRAPLGMYVLPAIVGKLLGGYAATLALWAQNSAALYIVLRVLTASSSVAKSLILLLVFCLFSGWDVPGAYATHIRGTVPDDIGWWAALFQYSSTITLVFWSPNHALAGWFVAALVLLWDRGRIGISGLAIGAAMATFWSPFALIGGMPFLVKAGIEAWRGHHIRAAEVGRVMIVAIGMIPLARYLGTDSAAVPHGFQPLSMLFFTIYGMFIFWEILPFAYLNYRFGAEATGFKRSTYRLALALLVLLPFYYLGIANDLVMRASIPALAIAAITTGETAFAVFQRGERSAKFMVAVVVALGALTGVWQIKLVLALPNHGTSTCDLVEAWDQDPHGSPTRAHYFANTQRVSPFFGLDRAHVHATGVSPVACVDQRLRHDR